MITYSTNDFLKATVGKAIRRASWDKSQKFIVDGLEKNDNEGDSVYISGKLSDRVCQFRMDTADNEDIWVFCNTGNPVICTMMVSKD